MAVLRWVVLHGRRAIVDGPLAKVDAVRAPFQHAAAAERADQTAPFFKVEAVEQPLVEGPPRRWAEIGVPIDNLLLRLWLCRQPTAHDRLHACRMSEDLLKFAELAGA